MTLSKIEYANKSNVASVVNRPTQATAEDFNEIKTIVNAAIDAINEILGSGTPETTSNKVTSLSGASTNVQYPSAKAVYDALQALSNAMGVPSQIELPAGSDLATRIGSATVPDGWSLEAVGDSGVKLQITHNLTGVKVETITVKALDIDGWQTLVNFKDAYSGIKELDNVITVTGIQNNLPLLIILRFA